MPSITAAAPGKIILFGEHAVVYGHPAIAVPVTQVRARATVSANPRAPSGLITIQAPAINLSASLNNLPADHPLAVVIQQVVTALGIRNLPACTIRITSTIPVAAGLGSGAAVSVALIRALSAFLGHPLSDEKVSSLAYEVEKIYHGTPSGIDNTVITYAKPVFFVRDHPIEIIQVRQPFTLVIGDTGVPSPTKITVSDVRKGWQSNPTYYEAIFEAIGQIVRAARQAIENGPVTALGSLMNENHDLLAKLGVSSPELERLIQAARLAGASGAKLSGGGRGGNMIALSHPGREAEIAQALRSAGAVRVITTEVRGEIIKHSGHKPQP